MHSNSSILMQFLASSPSIVFSNFIQYLVRNRFFPVKLELPKEVIQLRVTEDANGRLVKIISYLERTGRPSND